MEDLGLMDYYHVPRVCKQCGGVMVYRGIGEYQCEECGYEDYDDYGKARRYIEKNSGATAMDIENATGVSQKSIRRMLREARLEVASTSKVFLHCERCGKEIRSGQYCDECEMQLHRTIEEQQRELQRKGKTGYGIREQGDEGRRRFIHE
ncbi:MAG: flagellar operon protein YvyF [Acetatifactor sp.]|nr:flagellar operon protein YvyF [Acetatifactor sp.]